MTSQSAAGVDALMQYSSGMRCISAWLLRAILSVLALSSRQLAKLLYLGGRSLCWCTMMDQTQHAQHGQHDLRTGCPYCKLLSGVEGRKHKRHRVSTNRQQRHRQCRLSQTARAKQNHMAAQQLKLLPGNQSSCKPNARHLATTVICLLAPEMPFTPGCGL